jgi:hypothetical protein
MVRRERLIIDHVRVERSEIEETGQYSLDGPFIRIARAIETVNPISNLIAAGMVSQTNAMLVRLIAMFTSLMTQGGCLEQTELRAAKANGAHGGR